MGCSMCVCVCRSENNLGCWRSPSILCEPGKPVVRRCVNHSWPTASQGSSVLPQEHWNGCSMADFTQPDDEHGVLPAWVFSGHQLALPSFSFPAHSKSTAPATLTSPPPPPLALVPLLASHPSSLLPVLLEGLAQWSGPQTPNSLCPQPPLLAEGTREPICPCFQVTGWSILTLASLLS